MLQPQALPVHSIHMGGPPQPQPPTSQLQRSSDGSGAGNVSRSRTDGGGGSAHDLEVDIGGARLQELRTSYEAGEVAQADGTSGAVQAPHPPEDAAITDADLSSPRRPQSRSGSPPRQQSTNETVQGGVYIPGVDLRNFTEHEQARIVEAIQNLYVALGGSSATRWQLRPGSIWIVALDSNPLLPDIVSSPTIWSMSSMLVGFL